MNRLGIAEMANCAPETLSIFKAVAKFTRCCSLFTALMFVSHANRHHTFGVLYIANTCTYHSQVHVP